MMLIISITHSVVINVSLRHRINTVANYYLSFVQRATQNKNRKQTFSGCKEIEVKLVKLHCKWVNSRKYCKIEKSLKWKWNHRRAAVNATSFTLHLILFYKGNWLLSPFCVSVFVYLCLKIVFRCAPLGLQEAKIA